MCDNIKHELNVFESDSHRFYIYGNNCNIVAKTVVVGDKEYCLLVAKNKCDSSTFINILVECECEYDVDITLLDSDNHSLKTYNILYPMGILYKYEINRFDHPEFLISVKCNPTVLKGQWAQIPPPANFLLRGETRNQN